jgi:hypothetical protein
MAYTIEDLSKYRLNSIQEIDAIAEKIGEVKFYAYYDTVRIIIKNLQPGAFYDIVANVRPENIEVFIKCVCLYIRRTAGDCNFVLSDDYTKVKGIQSFNAGRAKMKAYQEQVKRMTPYEKKQ